MSVRKGRAFRRMPQLFSDSCQRAYSASVRVKAFFSGPDLKLMRPRSASMYGNAGRDSEAALLVGAIGVLALRSRRFSRFQWPSALRARFRLGSERLRREISRCPRSRELTRR